MLVNFYLNNKIKKIIFRPHNIYGPAMGYEHVIPQFIKKIVISSKKLTKKQIDLKSKEMVRKQDHFVILMMLLNKFFFVQNLVKIKIFTILEKIKR